MSFLKIVKTFDGHNINDGSNYRAAIVNTNMLPQAKPVFIEQMRSDAVDSGAWTVDVGTLAVYIRIMNRANINTLAAQLKNWFKRGTRGDLVVTFLDESKDFLKTCRVVNVTPDADSDDVWVAQLQTGATAWRAVSASTYTWNLSGTGGTRTEALPATDDETRLSVSFEASGLPTVGYLYQRLYRLAPPSGVSYGVRPWQVVMDTAALVGDTSKSNQINQVGGITNSATTIPIDTAVGGGLPAKGLGYVDTEQIAWTGNSGTQLTGVTRGLHGTTAATHADNAVIKLSHMQADCNDLRVFLGDVETRRWIVSPNNASTKIWFIVDLKTGFRLTLASALDGSSNYTSLQFTANATHQQMIAVMPDEGIVYHGTEWISYRGRDAVGCKLLNPTRGILSTTKQAHSVSDTFDYLPAAVKIVYGNSGVEDPAAGDIYYDETKPVFDLASSDNTQWVYSASTVFYDPLNTNRPGAWQQSIARTGNTSGLYNYTQDGVSPAAPAMGMKIAAWLNGTVWQFENATMAWQFNSAGGIQEISATGQTYRNSGGYPVVAALQYQQLVTTTITSTVRRKKRAVNTTSQISSLQWLSAWNENSPASISTWTAWTHSTVSVPTATTWVRFALSGVLQAMADAMAALEVLTLTVKFTTANIPSGLLLSETSNYQLDIQMINNTTGESFTVFFPMRTGVGFVIDGEAYMVTYEGVNAHEAMTLNDESRDAFMRLVAGNNDLQVISTDLGSLTGTLTYYRRRL
jgi:hypothetical protein